MAYDDIATLGIDIRTERVKDAIHKLEELESQSKRAETATQRLANESEAAARSMHGMTNGAGSLAGMMSKAASQILAVVAAYKTLTGVFSMLNTGFRYNEQLEKAQLGIASVIAATMNLSDAQGKILEGQEKFTAAQQMSVEMAKALDVASMQSPAGYVDLLSSFQRLLAPATQLGIKWQDTLDITIKMSNVLSSLGLEMDRLGMETEAILTGKNLTNSQVAMRLGLTKEELASWGQGEKLLAAFQKRFEAFKYAGLAVEDTMEAVREYYNDVLANASGDAVSGLWDSMKASMLEVAEAFYMIDEETQKFRKTDEWEALSTVLNNIGTALGGGMVDATKSLVSSMQALGTFIGQRGPDVFFDDLKDGATIAAAALGALVIARRAATLEFVIASGEEKKTVYGVLPYIAAVRQKISADMQASAATQAHSASMLRYQSSLAGATAKTVALAAASRGAATASAAFSGLLGIFGGPWGLALTAAAAGVTYLATSQDSATRSVTASEQAMSSYAEVMRKVKKETGEYTRELDKQTRAELESAQANNTIAQQRAKAELESKLSSMLSSAKHTQLGEDFAGGFGPINDWADAIPKKFTAGMAEILQQFHSGELGSDGLKEKLHELNAAVVQAGYGNTDFSQSLRDLVSASDGALAKLIQLIAQGKSLAEAMKDAASGVNTLGSAGKGINFGSLLEDAKLSAFTAGLKDGDKAFAQALISMSHKPGSNITAENIIGAVRDKNYEFAADPAQLADARTYIDKAASVKSSTKGASSVENATDKIRKFREEIQQLNGTASKATNSMADKLADIDKAGKSAKMSAQEVAKLKEEYQAAFKTDALKKFDKELLQVEGRASELRQIEVAEKLKEWRNQLEGVGLSAEEVEQKLAKMQVALGRQSQEKDLQTSINFYRELADMSGNYVQLTDLQTQAIERQGAAYERAGIDAHLVRQWEALNRLQEDRSPWAGMTRGMIKYANEATNLGQQLENVFTRAFSGMEDAFLRFTQTGKISFHDMANSIVADLMRIAIRASITGPLAQGLGSMLGGLFSSGGGGGMSASAAAGAANVSGYSQNMGVRFSGMSAKGNVFSGGNLHEYSGSIVTSPTIFGYGSHLTAYARGAGLMGEAGPEAIMPLARTSTGDLGVRVAGSGRNNGGPTVNITIHNSTGTQMAAQGEIRQDSQGNFNLDILVTQLEQNMVANARSGRSPYTSYLDSTRGLSRASTLQRVRR